MNPCSVFARALALAAVGVSALLLPTAKAQANPQLLPYMTSLVAGGGSSSTFTVGQACPSGGGKTATDAYGDGCLATEVTLTTPRYVTADSSGNIFFSDGGNQLIRRIDALTGIITLYAGGASANPASGTACGAFTSTDWQGDGCLATAIKLGLPSGIAYNPTNGDIYFSDPYSTATVGNATVRRIDHTTGVVTNVAGWTGGTKSFYGYSEHVVAATGGYLRYPAGISFDAVGNLYIPEEYYNAILVVNTTSSSKTVAGVTIAPGYIERIAGAKTVSSAPAACISYPTSGYGCSYGKWTDNSTATLSYIDAPYQVVPDNLGNVYFANEYNAAVGKIDSTGKISTWAGTQASATVTNQRGVANTIPIGSNFGISADVDGNVYTSDSLKGWVWRVDAANQGLYVFAGAASSVCSGDNIYGDGCPAAETKFTANPASSGTYASGVTVQGLYSDALGNLLLVDASAGRIHKFSTNADFGTIYPTNPSQTIDIHFGANDVKASSNPYVITTNAQNFTVGSDTCTTNTDNTQDCLLSITANPTVEGAFTGVLTVTSAAGKVGTFTLKGVLKTSRAASTTGLAVSSATTNPADPITLTATVSPANGASGGTVNFYDGSALIGTSTANSSGIATLTYTFPLGTHSVTASFVENLFLYASTSPAISVVSLTPSVGVSVGNTSLTVAQGQYGLTNLTLSSIGLYSGTVTFGCTGLPANASCVFNPSSVTVSTTSAPTVALTIKTQSTTSASVTMPGALNKGIAFALLPGFALLFFGLRRKRTRLPSMLLLAVLSVMASMGLTGCGSGVTPLSPTPTGTYTVTVTATGTPSVLSGTTNVTTVATLTLKVTN